MKLSPFYNRSRDLAITVTEGERVVFSDPLSRTLFSEEAPPPLPYGDKEGRLIEGAKPYLLIRRELRLPKRQFAVYAALPLAKSELEEPQGYADLVESVVTDLRTRFLLLFPSEPDALPPSPLPIRAYFARVCEEICCDLYAPLDVQIPDIAANASVLVRRKPLSQAIGLALAALLCEGQSGVCARLSLECDLVRLSLVGERSVESEFIRTLLSAIAERGAFTIDYDACAVHLLLSYAHTPAVALRSTDPSGEVADLLAGFTMLL